MVVPAPDVLSGRAPQLDGVGDVVRVVDEPAVDHRRGHLGVELDPDRGTEPERLGRDVAPRELGRTGGEIVGVVVPLERVEAAWQHVEHRVVPGALDGEPTDLGGARRAHGSPGCPGDHLRAEADAEERSATLEVLRQEIVLSPQPAVLLILVGMHRAAEHEHGIGRAARSVVERHAPGVELVSRRAHRLPEHAWADVRAVGDCQDSHRRQLMRLVESREWTLGRSACSIPASAGSPCCTSAW